MTEHLPCTDPTCAICAQERCVAGFRGEQTSEEASVLTCPECGHQFTPTTAPTRVTEAVQTHDLEVYAKDTRNSMTEAMINGSRSFEDIKDLVRRAIRAMLTASGGYDGYCWAYIVDISDTDVVYMVGDDDLYQCPYTLAGDQVTLGEPVKVVRTYMPAPLDPEPVESDVVESARPPRRVEIGGTARVLEAKGTDGAGNRIFRVRIIAYGDSKNSRRYPEAVLRAAAPLYEGAKAFDHHRSPEEMASGTIQGMVGYYRDVAAEQLGLEADLVLLPSAVQAAEALDAALALEGADPLVGISHDAYAMFRPIQEAGRQMQEATEITSVNSADIVAHPAAGGLATRVVAGGLNPDDPEGSKPAGESKEPEVPPTKAEVLAAFQEATDEELAAVGLARAATETTETDTEPTEPQKTTESDEMLAKHTFLARTLIKGAVTEAGLPKEFVKAVTDSLPEQVSEAMVLAQIGAVKSTLAIHERADLRPGVAGAKVTQEAMAKKIQALDDFFTPNSTKGYRSFKEAYFDFTGARRYAFDEDENREILRESFGIGFDNAATRATESMDSSTWSLVLGDSVTRRMVAEYRRPSLQTWRLIVSVVPVSDFREQKIERVGGYGTLPTVNQGAPYQPLTSPGQEEAKYTLTKKGGTEDLTLEMIANDDIRAISRIPFKMGLAAAQTLYRFVWDTLPTNAATSFDSVALFHSSHANTDNPAVLSQSTLDAGRAKMRQQTAFGDTKDVLSIVPKYLIVPSALESTAFKLCTSAVAIPSSGEASDVPNIHQGMQPIVIDYYTDANDWFLSADPMDTPTIEIGFYGGREEPEMFTQADNTTGSVFNADKYTWKIRHIYFGTVTDYRGFYRGAN